MKSLITTTLVAATFSGITGLVMHYTTTVIYEPPPPILSPATAPPPVAAQEPFDYERQAREVAKAIEAERAEAERIRLASLRKQECDFWGADFKSGC